MIERLHFLRHYAIICHAFRHIIISIIFFRHFGFRFRFHSRHYFLHGFISFISSPLFHDAAAFFCRFSDISIFLSLRCCCHAGTMRYQQRRGASEMVRRQLKMRAGMRAARRGSAARADARAPCALLAGAIDITIDACYDFAHCRLIFRFSFCLRFCRRRFSPFSDFRSSFS
jgi:hypothetical protein